MAVTCTYCGKPAQLLTGNVLYPGRLDFANSNFWKCFGCDAYVGCHRAGTYSVVKGHRVEHVGTEPLGILANAQLRRAKSAVHEVFDPLWKSGLMGRNAAYQWLAKQLGIPKRLCHIGLFDIERCNQVIRIVKQRGSSTP